MTYCKENMLSNRVIFYCVCNVICFPTWCRKTDQIHGCIISCSTYISMYYLYLKIDSLVLLWKWLKITINLKCKLASISMYTHTWHQIPLEKTHISYILLGFMPQAKKVILEKKKNCFCWGNPKPASHCHPNWSSHLSRLLPSIPGEKSTFQNWAWWIRNHRSFF